MGAGGARAATWLEATSPHFVIYSDGSEAVLRNYVDQLEALDAAFWLTWGLERPAGAVRRLPIYLVTSTDTFSQVRPSVGRNLAGFYVATPNITFAMGISGSKNNEVVLHEYAHHLMLQYFPGAYPAWLVEGYASYFQGTDIDARIVQVGRASSSLASTLTNDRWIEMEDVLSKKPSALERGEQGRFYGQSWLLTHYLLSDPARARQLDAYLVKVAAGQPSARAMQEATGLSLEELEKQLKTYAIRPLSMLQFSRSQLPKVEVTVRRLPPAEGDLLLDNLAVKSLGIEKPQGAPVLARIRTAAARYPDDAFAQRTLARAEHYFGDRAVAEAIIKKRVAADPRDTEAMAIYADLLMDKGDDDPAKAAELYNLASNVLAASFRVDPNNYATLNDFARSKVYEPGYPSDNTLTAQLTAVKLAPQVADNRVRAAYSLIERKRYREAKMMLGPLLNDPHSGEPSQGLKELLAKIPPETP